MSISIKPIILKSKVGVEGLCPICIRITINRVPYYLHIDKKIDPKEWDTAAGYVKATNPNQMRLNKFIKKELAHVEEIILKLQDTGQEVIYRRILAEYKQVEKDFHTFCEQEVINNPKNLSINRLKTVRTSLRILKKFQKSLLASSINSGFVERYIAYLRKSQNSENSVITHISIFRTFFNAAKKLGLASGTPFDGYSFQFQDGSKNFLEINELNKLWLLWKTKELEIKFPIRNKNAISHQEILRGFLFCVYAAGMRYGDYIKFQRNCIHSDGLRFVRSKDRKKKTIFVPLHAKLRELIPETDMGKNAVFQSHRGNNSRANRDLAEIMKVAEIEKHITFHCARHTFAMISLELDIDLIRLKELLGHSRVSTTEVYAKLKDKEKVKAMDKWDSL